MQKPRRHHEEPIKFLVKIPYSSFRDDFHQNWHSVWKNTEQFNKPKHTKDSGLSTRTATSKILLTQNVNWCRIKTYHSTKWKKSRVTKWHTKFACAQVLSCLASFRRWITAWKTRLIDVNYALINIFICLLVYVCCVGNISLAVNVNISHPYPLKWMAQHFCNFFSRCPSYFSYNIKYYLLAPFRELRFAYLSQSSLNCLTQSNVFQFFRLLFFYCTRLFSIEWQKVIWVQRQKRAVSCIISVIRLKTHSLDTLAYDKSFL